MNKLESKERRSVREYLDPLAYSVFIEPRLKNVREAIASNVRGKVIDIGCGTGGLAFLLEEKGCTVTGIDLSDGNIQRANQSKANNSKIRFAQGDATNLEQFQNRSFDFATMSLFLHALPEELRLNAIQEAVRIAQTVVIADYAVPLPKSILGKGLRVVERFGNHSDQFLSYHRNGGLDALLHQSNLEITSEILTPSKCVRVISAKKEDN